MNKYSRLLTFSTKKTENGEIVIGLHANCDETQHTLSVTEESYGIDDEMLGVDHQNLEIKFATPCDGSCCDWEKTCGDPGG
jgi:hypothetical protein